LDNNQLYLHVISNLKKERKEHFLLTNPIIKKHKHKEKSSFYRIYHFACFSFLCPRSSCGCYVHDHNFSQQFVWWSITQIWRGKKK